MRTLICPSGSRCNAKDALEIPERPWIAWEDDDAILEQAGKLIHHLSTCSPKHVKVTQHYLSYQTPWPTDWLAEATPKPGPLLHQGTYNEDPVPGTGTRHPKPLPAEPEGPKLVWAK